MVQIIDQNSVKLFKSLKGITLLHSNTRSLYKNFDEFKAIIEELKPNIVCVTETWLKDHHQDIEVRINGYELIRKDRTDMRGGGVAMYYTNRLIVKQIEIESNYEILIFDIKTKNSKSFKLCILYRKPEPEADFLEFWEQFLANNSNQELIIVGDININLIIKNTNYEKIFKDRGFNQLISEPTRVTESTTSIIDHILTNSMHNISGAGVLDLSVSDHKILYSGRKINFNIKEKSEKRAISFRCLSRIDILQLFKLIDTKTPFHYCNEELNVNEFCQKLMQL